MFQILEAIAMPTAKPRLSVILSELTLQLIGMRAPRIPGGASTSVAIEEALDGYLYVVRAARPRLKGQLQPREWRMLVDALAPVLSAAAPTQPIPLATLIDALRSISGPDQYGQADFIGGLLLNKLYKPRPEGLAFSALEEAALVDVIRMWWRLSADSRPDLETYLGHLISLESQVDTTIS